MSKKIRIGFLPLTKVNWTNEAMQKQRRDAIEMLSKIPNVEIVGGEDMIETEEQSLKILERFEKDRPDMLVALFTTFALGTIVSLFAKRLKVPVVLWSIKEPDPAGGRRGFRADRAGDPHPRERDGARGGGVRRRARHVAGRVSRFARSARAAHRAGACGPSFG